MIACRKYFSPVIFVVSLHSTNSSLDLLLLFVYLFLIFFFGLSLSLTLSHCLAPARVRKQKKKIVGCECDRVYLLHVWSEKKTDWSKVRDNSEKAELKEIQTLHDVFRTDDGIEAVVRAAVQRHTQCRRHVHSECSLEMDFVKCVVSLSPSHSVYLCAQHDHNTNAYGMI